MPAAPSWVLLLLVVGMVGVVGVVGVVLLSHHHGGLVRVCL
jgi:hypothetical protein